MRSRLVILTVITGAALIGIVGLQAFWLTNLYVQQKEHFKEDISNTLATAILRDQVTSQLASYIQKPGDTISNVRLKIGGGMLTNMLKNNPVAEKQVEDLNKSINIEITEDPKDREQRQKLKNKIVSDMNEFPARGNDSIPVAVFNKYRRLLKDELQKRAIHAPFELALVNKKGAIIHATCDTALFSGAIYKSPACQYNFESSYPPYLLQAAFPGSNFYLLQKMIWLLTVSGLLVLICVGSFTYLIFLFFREKRLTEMRTDFMNNMTHELKTPISSVSVALELVSDEQRPVSKESRKEYLEIARSELKRLLLLIERVLKMAAFEKKEIQLHKEHFEVAQWLKEQMIQMKPMFESAAAIVHTKVLPSELTIYADETHLTSMLHNLVENALKYNDKSLPEIEIDIKGETGFVSFTVKDNGRGIPPYYLSRIFDQFLRVPYGDKHDVKGHGLGLSYVKAISELHGGSVEVSSRLNEGSIFTVKIPD